MVWDLVNRLESLHDQPRTQVKSEIGHIFLIDRDVDFVSALSTQTTYEGLIDELFGIRSGKKKLTQVEILRVFLSWRCLIVIQR